MIPEAAVEAAWCTHSFVRRPGWWRHRKSWMRWECECGLTTRTYDSVDRMGTRPIHPRMTVAVPSYNTKGRRWPSQVIPEAAVEAAARVLIEDGQWGVPWDDASEED